MPHYSILASTCDSILHQIEIICRPIDDVTRFTITLATPAEVPEEKKTQPLDCQTSPKTRIEPKGLFPAVANHAGAPDAWRLLRASSGPWALRLRRQMARRY